MEDFMTNFEAFFAETPMLSRYDSSRVPKMVRDAITQSIGAIQTLNEVQATLAKWLADTKHIWIWGETGDYRVTDITNIADVLYQSASYTACLEFALRYQPEPVGEKAE
jgi:hypothetical protein